MTKTRTQQRGGVAEWCQKCGLWVMPVAMGQSGAFRWMCLTCRGLTAPGKTTKEMAEKEVTNYYVCGACHLPCDTMTPPPADTMQRLRSLCCNAPATPAKE